MTLEQWAYVAQIAGVLLIIASLVYVAVQVQQNTNAQLTASRQAMYLRITEFAWYQYQNGILDRVSWESFMAPTAAVFEAERARRVWESNVIRLDPSFRAHIDQALADAAS